MTDGPGNTARHALASPSVILCSKCELDAVRRLFSEPHVFQNYDVKCGGRKRTEEAARPPTILSTETVMESIPGHLHTAGPFALFPAISRTSARLHEFFSRECCTHQTVACLHCVLLICVSQCTWQHSAPHTHTRTTGVFKTIWRVTRQRASHVQVRASFTLR